MKEKYLIGLANLSNGALLGYGNKEVVEENKTRVNDYVKELESIRDKAIEYIKKHIEEGYSEVYDCDIRCDSVSGDELLEILESGDSNE